MTDLRALITQLCDELDHNRQCLLDDRRLTHPLSDKARAALVETDGPAVSGDREPASVAKQCSGELSPAAKAVLDAYIRGLATKRRNAIAAALRAAVEQVLYEEKLGWTGYGYYTHFQNQILAIVDELETQ